MCQPNQKCPQCLIAKNQIKEKVEVFTCQICQVNFEKGMKFEVSISELE